MSRTLLRRAVVALSTSVLLVSLAWAGTGLVPVATPPVDEVGLEPPDTATTAARPAAPGNEHGKGKGKGRGKGGGGDAPPAGAVLLVGASKVSLYPRPEDYQARFPGARWERDWAACATLSEDVFTALAERGLAHAEHLATATTSPWPENPDCLYMGGFGIGPMNPITGWDLGPGDPGYAESGLGEDGDPTTGLGLWVRTLALSDGEDTVVYTVLDAEGYFWDYATKCADCGVAQLTAELGAELGIDPDGITIAATHAHSAMDLIGGWGFVPDWYMAQVADAIRSSIREAVTSARPAVVEIGEERARPFNSERRDTYRSAEEQQISWLRALDAETGEVIATLGAYAAHPTTRGTNDGIAHADWPGVFAHRLEERFGGVGLLIMSGLGNMSARGGTAMGAALADLLPDPGQGHVLADGDIRTTRARWLQPVTNAPLSALGLPGFFDREFLAQPAAVRVGKEPDTAPCVSSSPYSVELVATATRVGSELAITTAPGEVFANLTNTIKERSGALVTLPLGQANDALGYMPQSFEINPVGQQGLGFVIGGYLFVNYEDSYAIDRCVGDQVLETTLGLLAGL